MAVEEALSSLLSGVASGRRYWGRAENLSAAQGAYLVLNRISAPRNYTLDGPESYIAARFQIDAYAAEYSQARAAADAATATLSGYRGMVLGVRILGIFVDSERDMQANDNQLEAQHLFRRSIDLTIHYHE